MHHVFRILSILVLCSCLSCRTANKRPSRSRYGNRIPPVVAVMEFDNRSGFTGQWKLGTDMADLLVAELMDSNKVRVVERQRIGEVLGELALQDQPLFRTEGRVDRGQLLNARYQIRGVITDFSQVRGGGFWLGVKDFFLRGKSFTARVALTLTVVDVQSGEIIGSAQADGEAKARSAYVAAEYKGVYFGGESFSRTPLGSATNKAIREAVEELNDQFPYRPWRPQIAETLSDGRILLNGGRDRKLEANTVYRVLGPVRLVTDPVNGDVLTRLPGKELGRILLVEVQDRISICRPVEGGPFPRGAFVEQDFSVNTPDG